MNLGTQPTSFNRSRMPSVAKRTSVENAGRGPISFDSQSMSASIRESASGFIAPIYLTSENQPRSTRRHFALRRVGSRQGNEIHLRYFLCRESGKGMGSLQILFKRYLRKNMPSYLAGTVCLLATNYLSVTIPEQIGAAVDVLTTPENLSAISPYVFNIAWMGLTVVVVRTLSRVLFFNPGRDVEYRIRRDMFSNLLHLPPAFYATQNRGDIISRASSDITWVRALIGFGGMQSINLILALSLTLWKMGSVSWVLTAITLAPIVLGTIIVQGAIRSWYPMMKRNQEYLANISEHVLESLNGITTIQGFQAAPAFMRELAVETRRGLTTISNSNWCNPPFYPSLPYLGGRRYFCCFILELRCWKMEP